MHPLFEGQIMSQEFNSNCAVQERRHIGQTGIENILARKRVTNFGINRGRQKTTRVYHISYTPVTKEVSLFFWGCNFDCKGCLSKKETSNFLLKENLHLFSTEPGTIASPPTKFLSFSRVLDLLDKCEIKTVLFEGQEAGLDPIMPELAKVLHERYGTYNILCTNGYRVPPLDDIDRVQMSIKALDDSLHVDYTGKSNQRVLKNFIEMAGSGIKLSTATVLIPGYIESQEIERVARFISCVNKDIPFNVLPYFKAGNNPWRRPTHNEMNEAGTAARQHLRHVYAWHGDEELTYEVMRIF